jgi:hypothetical protein
VNAERYFRGAKGDYHKFTAYTGTVPGQADENPDLLIVCGLGTIVIAKDQLVFMTRLVVRYDRTELAFDKSCRYLTALAYRPNHRTSNR